MLSTDDNDEVEKYFLDNLHNNSNLRDFTIATSFGRPTKKIMNSVNFPTRIFDNQQSRNSEDTPVRYFFFLILFFVNIRGEGFL